MTQNKVMKLWTAVITALLALCTTLGLITTTAAAAVPQAEAPRNSTAAQTTVSAMSHWAWSHSKALPPTMKQRIRAEAHGSSPSCRHRPPADTDAADADALRDLADSQPLTEAEAEAELGAPLQR